MQHGKWYIADIYVFGNDDIFQATKPPWNKFTQSQPSLQ